MQYLIFTKETAKRVLQFWFYLLGQQHLDPQHLTQCREEQHLKLHQDLQRPKHCKSLRLQKQHQVQIMQVFFVRCDR